jgi:LPS sulfotransferase NodH
MWWPPHHGPEVPCCVDSFGISGKSVRPRNISIRCRCAIGKSVWENLPGGALSVVACVGPQSAFWGSIVGHRTNYIATCSGYESDVPVRKSCSGSKASLEEVVSPRQWIFLRREDRVAQAVSWARALQSGRWAAHQKFALPVVYRRRQIQRLVGLVDAQESAWETFFSAGKIEPLRLRYEDILEDRERSLRNVLDFLGVAGASEIALPEPDLERQSDALNQLWIERYRSES